MVTSHKEIMILLLGKSELCVYRVPPSKIYRPDFVLVLTTVLVIIPFFILFEIVLFPKTSSTTSVPETQIFTLP